MQNGVAASKVADFDLRKMIVHEVTITPDLYNIVTTTEMSAVVNIVLESARGIVKGTLTDYVSASGKVMACTYKKGTYNRTTEMQAQAASSIEFKIE